MVTNVNISFKKRVYVDEEELQNILENDKNVNYECKMICSGFVDGKQSFDIEVYSNENNTLGDIECYIYSLLGEHNIKASVDAYEQLLS